jgi:hypothetical protein
MKLATPTSTTLWLPRTPRDMARFDVLLRQIPQWLAPVILVCATIAICWRLLSSQFQFAINDLGPFGPSMLRSCLLTYDDSGLGRENPHTIPSYCDFGLLSVFLGGVVAQHLFLVTCFVAAGLSMYFLLRRIGNPQAICLLGAVAYEFSPIMLSWQNSGEGLIFTAALLPAVLMGAIPRPGSSPYVDGARSGALLAVVCYANPQAPTLAAFLLLPAIGMTLLLRRAPLRSGVRRQRAMRGTRGALIFAASFLGVFLLAAAPVLQILPGFGTMIQGMRAENQSDFLIRLAANSPRDFLIPYLVVGVVPAIFGFLLLSSLSDVRPSELAAGVSFASILLFWSALRLAGPSVASVLPLVTLYKDFIKLQIVLSVPLVILSAMALRWAGRLKVAGAIGLPRYGAITAIGTLVLLPLVFGNQPAALYVTGPTTTLNGQALISGQLGLPSWARLPPAYSDVLGSLRRADPDTQSYRVLWMPIDWRLIQMSRVSDVNLLLYRADASAASRQAIADAFSAIVNDQEEQIAARLADQSVKYIVVDMTDGQDRNAEPWETGPRTLAAVWNSEVLAGQPGDYKRVLAKTPGLSVLQDTGRLVIYRNLDWRPQLESYQALLVVAPPLWRQPEQLLSLWHELPGYLIETGTQSTSAPPLPTVRLGAGPEAAVGPGQIRLLTASDLKVTGIWGIDSVPSGLGIERFSNLGGGSLTVPATLLKSAPPGSQIMWIEYKPSETEPSNGVVRSMPASAASPILRCQNANCAIANVLLVPDSSGYKQVARLAEAYSPLLRTSDGERPMQSPGDWATLYSPPPHGYPSALYDRSTLVRFLGVVFGHLIALAGLLLGPFRRL